MVEATELTYENMKQFCIDYCNFFRQPGQLDEAKYREFFAPDCKIIRRFSRNFVGASGREEWVKRICRHVGKLFRVEMSWDTSPLGIIVDERRNMAVHLFEEVYKNPVTGEILTPQREWGVENPHEYRIVVWEFCIHDNKVKAKSELIIRPLVEPL